MCEGRSAPSQDGRSALPRRSALRTATGCAPAAMTGGRPRAPAMTNGPLAQLVEQRTLNPEVEGSSPSGVTQAQHKALVVPSRALLYVQVIAEFIAELTRGRSTWLSQARPAAWAGQLATCCESGGMVDAPDLGSGAPGRGGSSPPSRTDSIAVGLSHRLNCGRDLAAQVGPEPCPSRARARPLCPTGSGVSPNVPRRHRVGA